ncbi:MAG: CAP domain-containing protein [Sulfobacillus acidophilus]|uniref:CAP domain-containing protein n=1 Tax=Sulfobacillus acidophilus TaxID=53633 RepID=A0A2T2WCU3_9FIRM|nr:MAG: CAP domain-containing protein [Sulfobacillus acidophilus]
MSYFSALLLAAGLPLSLGSAGPVTITTAPVVYTLNPMPGIATVSQAYQTMQQVTSSGSSSSVQPALVPTATSTSEPPPSASGNAGSTLSSEANEMINLINQARVQAGLAPYTVNATLMTLAQERALALATGPFTSDLPQYGWPIQMEDAAGIEGQGMGAENIVEAASVSQAFSLLMGSAPHKANILNPDETQIGVGVAPWGMGVAISELFIGPNI